MTIGEIIKSQRIAYGLTQEELGEKLGVRKEKIQKWECGYVDTIPLSKIRSMAKLFKIMPSKLIEGEAVKTTGEMLYPKLDTELYITKQFK